jgi:hypothetical protein
MLCFDFVLFSVKVSSCNQQIHVDDSTHYPYIPDNVEFTALGSIKCWKVLEWLHSWRLLKKGSAPWVSEWVSEWVNMWHWLTIKYLKRYLNCYWGTHQSRKPRRHLLIEFHLDIRGICCTWYHCMPTSIRIYMMIINLLQKSFTV